MAQTLLITLTTAGSDTGPFNLYSNVDGYLVPFETNVPKASLQAGYLSMLVPDGAYIIQVKSENALCSNYVNLVLATTTTSTSSTTTTSTTTALPVMVVNNDSVEGGLSITNVTIDGQTFTPTSGSFPLASTESLTGQVNGAGTFTIRVTVGVSVAAQNIFILYSNGTYECQNVDSPGEYVFSGVVNSTSPVGITVSDGACF
jgi:hypothetical protein